MVDRAALLTAKRVLKITSMAQLTQKETISTAKLLSHRANIPTAAGGIATSIATRTAPQTKDRASLDTTVTRTQNSTNTSKATDHTSSSSSSTTKSRLSKEWRKTAS
jgi:hypothetical protein